ncbi:MAG: tyrosine-type recombinase/integrase, partial [Mycobacteriales bacterium]
MPDSPMELLLRSWQRALRARGLSPDTLSGYTDTVNNFRRWRVKEELPLDPQATTRDEIIDWTTWLLETRAAGTAEARFTGLKAFFTWLAAEGEITANPMATLKAPKAPESPVNVIPAEDIEVLLRFLAGNDFYSRRDLALIATYIDTGARRRELARLTVDDVDLDLRRIGIT